MPETMIKSPIDCETSSILEKTIVKIIGLNEDNW